MKVTKYPQSCLVLEKDGQRIVIDPGSLFTARFGRQELGDVSAVLITHKHGDHFDDDFLAGILKERIPVFANQEVASMMEGIQAIESGKKFEVAGFSVMPHDLPHCRVPKIYGIAQNTGYIIDGTFFHPGDGVETSGLVVHDAAVPVAGPDISFYDAMEFIKMIQAQRVVPIHYHEHAYPANTLGLKTYTDEAGAELIVLDDGESAEL